MNDIDFTVGVLYIGGKSLSGHLSGFDTKTVYTYYEYSKSTGYWTKISKSIQTALELRQWTDVVLHEVSHLAYKVDTIDESLQPLIDKIRGHVSYDLNINYMVTPAYGESNDGYFEDMYNQLNSAANHIITNYPDINIMIPVHTAIQNARTNSILQTYGADLFASSADRHIEDGVGRLIEACTVYLSLQIAHCNRTPVTESTFVPIYGDNVNNGTGDIGMYPDTAEFSEITPEAIDLIYKAAIAANINPYQITTIN